MTIKSFSKGTAIMGSVNVTLAKLILYRFVKFIFEDCCMLKKESGSKFLLGKFLW
jgi:hypothetical protein